MAIVMAKCPDCHQIIKVDSSKQRANCNECGHMFSVDQAINEYYLQKDQDQKSTLYDKATPALNRKIERAEMYRKIQQPRKANALYRSITKKHHRNYAGWYGLLLVLTNQFTRLYLTKHDLRKTQKYMAKIQKLAEPAVADEISRKYQNYLNRQKKDQHLTMLRTYSLILTLVGLAITLLMLVLTAYIVYRIVTNNFEQRVYMTIAYIYFAAFIGISFGMAINFQKRARIYESRL